MRGRYWLHSVYFGLRLYMSSLAELYSPRTWQSRSSLQLSQVHGIRCLNSIRTHSVGHHSCWIAFSRVTQPDTRKGNRAAATEVGTSEFVGLT
jgi:hypothetical protein